MSRQILAQGDRDGACFLYAIANGYFTLTGKKMLQAKWGKAIKSIPFALDDYLSGRGTEKLDNNYDYLEGMCRDFIGNEFDVIGKKISKKSLRDLITTEQVALITINNGAHWVCLVDADKERFYIACSAAALESYSTYSEETSSRLGRIYNRTILFSDLDVWQDYAVFISTKSDE